MSALSIEEHEAELGARLRALRLNKNTSQAVLAGRAGISLRALKNLEGGQGAQLRTFLSVLRALGREDWLESVAPIPTLNPLHMTRSASPRQRARSRKQDVAL